MQTRRTKVPTLQDLLQHYECGPVQFSGDPNASYERHLVFDHVVEPQAASVRERFEAVARALRDLLVQR
jgi:glycogen phosphorylase